MQIVLSLNTWTGIRSNLIARHLIWYELNYRCDMLNKYDSYYIIVILVAKTADDGSKQAYYIRTFYAGCLFPRRATANTRVCILFYILCIYMCLCIHIFVLYYHLYFLLTILLNSYLFNMKS
jgi:hypothetical protein